MRKMELVVVVLLLGLFLSGCPWGSQQPPSSNNQTNNTYTNNTQTNSTQTKDTEINSTEQDNNTTEEVTQCSRIKQTGETIEPYPYVGGGESKDEGGFDCSGAIHYVQQAIGEPIPRTTSRKLGILASGESKNGSKSSCGDWTFFTFSPDRPKGHVGMITDNPNFYQSGSSTGPTKEIFIKDRFGDNKHIGTKSPNLE